MDGIYVFGQGAHPRTLFIFSVAYYQEIVCNKFFTSHLFGHDLLCTPPIIKQMGS